MKWQNRLKQNILDIVTELPSPFSLIEHKDRKTVQENGNDSQKNLNSQSS